MESIYKIAWPVLWEEKNNAFKTVYYKNIVYLKNYTLQFYFDKKEKNLCPEKFAKKAYL